jgi:excinuclease ABC subunit A
MKEIFIQGASQHNLKNIDVRIPRNSFTVVTGLSGSGKSSLAFDTLYAEGQRRYVESLSSYARQFLDQMQKPEVQHISGLSPAIAIEQRHAGSNPRSTVATTTEIYDYLRLLYAHVGLPHCPKCGERIQCQSAEDICQSIALFAVGKKLMILAPKLAGRKGEHRELLEELRKDGFVRARIDGQLVVLEDVKKLAKTKKHSVEVVVDRLKTGKSSDSRINDSVELALKLGDGTLLCLVENEHGEWDEKVMSEHLACLSCDVSFPKMAPRNFSFNSTYGACSTCSGLGYEMVFTPELVVKDPALSIKKGVFPLLRRGPRRLIMYYNHLFKALADHYGFSILTPWQELSSEIQDILLYGSHGEELNFDYYRGRKLYKMRMPFVGVLALLKKRFNETDSDAVRDRLRAVMVNKRCASCDGARLCPESLAVTVGGLSISEFNALSIKEAAQFLSQLELGVESQKIAGEILKEVKSRLSFLLDVGLDYLTLDRHSGTLSGGEAQRIKLATQLGCGLVGVLYILDEPSIGLHQRDNTRLLNTLKELRDAGNTVIVVEHDSETIESADYLLDLGPGAGRLGGELIFSGKPQDILSCPNSLTGAYLSGRKQIEIPQHRHKGTGEKITIVGASENNLRKVKVDFPLGTFCCVTGVSGSGKSTLVNKILKNSLVNRFAKPDKSGIVAHKVKVGQHQSIAGLENIDKMIVIDQSPIGRTPRSNPATYVGMFTYIRDLFANTKDAKARGYKKGRFSFNVKGGRCESCKGDGQKKIEMNFLPDVYVTCDACGGKRFNKETLSIRYKGKNIHEVLEMTVEDALAFFQHLTPIARKLQTLFDVGLGYIHLGQAATTLSGGEAQRIKLASELARVPKGHTLYILDEPTTGLHIADIHKLLSVLERLRSSGNTVLVIEHNLDVIKTADWIVDLGPEGGDLGGQVIAKGTPEQVAKNKKSYTGQYLKEILS